MSRSVSYPVNAVAVCYDDVSHLEDQWDWNMYKESIEEMAQHHWPSLICCDRWLGREDRAILENSHCYVGVSQYCGLAAIWLVYKDDGEYPQLAQEWAFQIMPKFEKIFGGLRKVATFSNGESVFEKIDREAA
jgi:hypothetical protein